jgi:DNA-binding NarL/FixJ family response regulator
MSCIEQRRVVLADDDTTVLTSLHQLFSAHGRLDVTAAVSSGDALLEAIEAHRPHLVVTDLHMPSGELALVERLGKLMPKPIVITLSAAVGPTLARRLVAAGADVVLRKGIDAPLAAAEALWDERVRSRG